MQTIDYYETPKPPKGEGLGQYIGVEIEFITDNASFEEIEDELRFHGLKDICLGEDSSVSSDPYGDNCDGLELCVLTKIDDLEPIKKTLAAIQNVDGYINSTCGLHVHLDMRHVSRKKAKAIAKRMANALPLLRSIVAPYRNKSRFCKDDLSRSGVRYAAINTESLSKHGTIEVRLHQGTLDFNKISNWIRLLYKLSRAVKVPKTRSLKTLAKAIKLNASMISYYNRRIKLMGMLNNLEPSEVAREISYNEAC
jgi:hypothetical protein